jgi:allophanate hydrolase
MKRRPPVWISEIDPAPAKDGPLRGLTFAIKDNIDYAGVPTTCACPESAYTPETHAACVAKLLDAGAVAVGKTNLDQFATGLVGVRSPYGACSSVFHKDYISGGSSSGSAVAVASGEVDFALGTDTAGSGRVPAAFNGIYGLKSTFGVIPTQGVVPACKTLDCVSVFSRTVAIARRVLETFDTRPPDVLPTGFRFGYVDFVGDPAYAPLYAAAIERAKAAGGSAVRIDYTPFREAAELLYAGPWVAERYAAVGRWLAHMHPVVKQIIGGATRYSAVDAFEARYRLDELRERTIGAWREMDVLLLPTTGWIYTIAEVDANPIERNTNLGYYTNFVNLLNLAALAIPAGFRADGLPFGVTLIGQAGSDYRLLELAERLDFLEIAVVGAHLTGQPLNRQLTERGATLVRTTATTREYRLYALAGTAPPKPGLVRETGFDGPGIEVEVWAMPAARFASFVAEIPPPLGIGTVALADGTAVKGFICEPQGLAGATEITHFGGWRAFRNSFR